MKLDKIKFASLIGFISCRYALTITPDDIYEMDAIIEFQIPDLAKADVNTVERLMSLMYQNTQKIEAIKAFRDLTGAGLKESKDAVERYWVSKVP